MPEPETLFDDYSGREVPISQHKARMLEDKYLRDSARALVEADIEHIKADFAHKGLGERAMDRITEGAMDLYEEAIDVAEDNKGAIAALVAFVMSLKRGERPPRPRVEVPEELRFDTDGRPDAKASHA